MSHPLQSTLGKRVLSSEKNNLIRSFSPGLLSRHHLVQTALSVHRPRSVEWLQAEEHPFLIDAGEDVTGYAPDRAVRLLAYYSPAQPKRDSSMKHGAYHQRIAPARGLVLMLHGWGGCSHSTYNLVVTERLVRSGYDVVRLNLRDHGPGIHYAPEALNPGVFLGTLIDEAHIATRRIAEMAQGRPFYIVGPSMGGNFALRIACKHGDMPIPNLRRVIAISPAINPSSATDSLDANWMYRRYFRGRWLSSLQAKAHFFPEHYVGLANVTEHLTVREMTDWLIPYVTPHSKANYTDAEEYFNHYAVSHEAISQLSVRADIITAKDDPVIPFQDFLELPKNPFLELHALKYGGHVGFIDLMPFHHWLPDMILSLLD